MRDPESDAIVIGAGVVGLSCALALAQRGERVLVLEKEAAVGLGLSSRNSGVVHAGIHHPADWLKTRLCIRGRELLEARCKRFGLPWAPVGKLVVACDEDELEALEAIRARAVENGAGPVRMLSRAEVEASEPMLRVAAALEVSATAVTRPRAIVRSLDEELKALRVEVACGIEVDAIEPGFTVQAGPISYRAPRLIVAAGLASDRLAVLAGLDALALGLRHHFCKGQWMALDDRYRKAVGRHVYPLPHPDRVGLGIHLTRDVDGFLTAGPDAEWVEAPDDALDPTRREAFAEAVGRYMPGVKADELHPLATGVRPKLSRPGEPARDFAIATEREHGRPGLVVLAGIESPGLTAALAIAEEVARR